MDEITAISYFNLGNFCLMDYSYLEVQARMRVEISSVLQSLFSDDRHKGHVRDLIGRSRVFVYPLFSSALNVWV